MSVQDQFLTLRELHDTDGAYRNRVRSRSFFSNLFAMFGAERGMANVSNPPAYCQELVLSVGSEDLRGEHYSFRADVIEHLSFIARKDPSQVCRSSAVVSLGKQLSQFPEINAAFETDKDAEEKALQLLKVIEEVYQNRKIREEIPNAKSRCLQAVQGLGNLDISLSSTGRAILNLLGGMLLAPLEDPEIASVMEKSIEKTAGLTILMTLFEGLGDASPPVRWDSAIVLGKLRGEKVVNRLLYALEREEVGLVKQKLAQALGHFVVDKDTEAGTEYKIRKGLISVLDFGDPNLKVLAMIFLNKRSGKNLGLDSEAWKKWWSTVQADGEGRG